MMPLLCLGRAKFGRLVSPEAQLSQMRIFCFGSDFFGGRGDNSRLRVWPGCGGYKFQPAKVKVTHG